MGRRKQATTGGARGAKRAKKKNTKKKVRRSHERTHVHTRKKKKKKKIVVPDKKKETHKESSSIWRPSLSLSLNSRHTQQVEHRTHTLPARLFLSLFGKNLLRIMKNNKCNRFERTIMKNENNERNKGLGRE